MNDYDLQVLLINSLQDILAPTAILPDFHPTFDLVDTGLLDSLGFLELISRLEEEIGQTFNLLEISPTELTTMGGLLILLRSAKFPGDSRTSAAD